jgi:hypothetical protein
MRDTRVIALFCEDIREERSGQDTLIGIMPDNINMGRYPSAVPKLGLYIRAHIDPDNPPSQIVAKLKTSWAESEIGRAEKELIELAAEQSKQKGIPLAGVILKAIIAPFQLKQPGLALLTVSIDGGEDAPCAVLNFLEPPAISSNEKPPP